ncbi:MAG: hypothetical protein K8D98_01610 [Rhodanobacter sp.]|nr:hypothetical protein [Rhodanobacter sp.]
MKQADKQHEAAKDEVVVRKGVVTLSVNAPIPPELARHAGESMGLYDRPEHPFRMYAALALG